MWEIKEPDPVKLIIGILAADKDCLARAVEVLAESFGKIDLISPAWNFNQTAYYKDELGENILKQFVTFEKLIDPGTLAEIKHRTNKLEEALAESLAIKLPRPVNLDPGFIEPSKHVLASTKNFSHRIYIGDNMYAEVTLMFSKGSWQSFVYTFPDYKETRYHEFLSKVRTKLTQQLRQVSGKGKSQCSN